MNWHEMVVTVVIDEFVPHSHLRKHLVSKLSKFIFSSGIHSSVCASHFNRLRIVLWYLFKSYQIYTRYYPRYHLGATCNDGSDSSCMNGESVCLSNLHVVTVRYDNINLGMEKLEQRQEVKLQISKSCSCKIFRKSIFAVLV